MVSLANENRQISKIVPDGNCFFRCISAAVYNHQCYRSSIRHDLVQFIRSNAHLFAALTDYSSNGSYNEYLNRMAQNSTWETQAEIFAAANYFQRRLRILTRIGEAWQWVHYDPRNIQSSQNYPIIDILHSNNHFDLLVLSTQSST